MVWSNHDYPVLTYPKEHPIWGITSLPAGVADVERLLALRRGPWRIENSRHYSKAAPVGEDSSQIPSGAGPAGRSLLRVAVVRWVQQAGLQQVAARSRYYSRHPAQLRTLRGLPIPENA